MAARDWEKLERLSFSLDASIFAKLSRSSMAFSDSSRRQSLIPTFLYSSSSQKIMPLEKMINNSSTFASMSSSPASNLESGSSRKSFMIAAPSEPGKIEMYSPAFYAACTFGGILSCGLTHTGVTPLDLVKCNMQVRFSLDLALLMKFDCNNGLSY